MAASIQSYVIVLTMTINGPKYSHLNGILLLFLLFISTLNGTNRKTPQYEPLIFDDTSLESYGCNNGSVTCSRKCCDNDYILLEDGNCSYNPTEFDVPVFENGVKSSTKSLGIRFVPGYINCDYDHGYYELPSFKNFVSLRKNGKFANNEDEIVYDYKEFCVEYLENQGTVAIICSSEDEIGLFQPLAVAIHINIVGEIISLPFLLATFIIYAILPDRNLHSKSLMCYVFALFMAFAVTVGIYFTENEFDGPSCIAPVVGCIFFFLSSFCWMNVMSFDIWSTFSGMSGFRGGRKRTERKRFLLYSAYGWGIPLLIVTIITICSVTDIPYDAWYNPGIGEYMECWFKDEIRELLYFYGPMGITTLTNFTFFIITTIKIRKVQNDTAMLSSQVSRKHGQEEDKYWFCLFLKLLLIMGLNWTMDFIAWIVDWMINNVPPAVWYLSDLCNALYGVLIFFLFCFNKKTWNQLKKRYYKCRGIQPPLATPNNTYTSSMSSRSIDNNPRLLRTTSNP